MLFWIAALLALICSILFWYVEVLQSRLRRSRDKIERLEDRLVDYDDYSMRMKYLDESNYCPEDPATVIRFPEDIKGETT